MSLLKVAKIFVFMLCLLYFIPLTAHANSSPIYMEQFPSLSIAPAGNFPIAVDQETLTIKVDQQSPSDAVVVVKYIMSNSSLEKLKVPMIFPFLSYGYEGFAPRIEFNGKAVDYRVLSAGHVEIMDYLSEPDKFKEQVNINRIIENLNMPLYQAKHFNDSANATLYEVTYTGPTDNESDISFNLDPDKTRVLTLGFDGFRFRQNGDCTVSSYMSNYNLGDTRYILVLGENTLTQISGSDDEVIEKKVVNIKDFIYNQLVESTSFLEGSFGYLNREPNDFYPVALKEVDRFFEEGQMVFSWAMLSENMAFRNNLFALLYEVDFEVDSTNTLVVTYPMTATLDRRDTVDPIYTFAYILNPAKNFSSFGGIDIHIELNSKYRYIIDSSIALNEVEASVFTASFDHLPDEDLVFSTYLKEEISFWEPLAVWLSQQYYLLLFIGPIILLLLLLIAVFLIANRRRRILNNH